MTLISSLPLASALALALVGLSALRGRIAAARLVPARVPVRSRPRRTEA